MKITIVGSGYVGLVTGACFSEMGNDVICVDKNTERVENLKNSIVPFYEHGLEDLLKKNINDGRLVFSSDIGNSIKQSLFIFIAVGTPPNEDGSADLNNVIKVAEEIGKNINDYKIIINKSTVPVGTADKVKKVVVDEMKKRNVTHVFDVVSNPEFLKEGNAIEDFMKPDRVVIGTDSQKALELMEEIYSPFFRQRSRFVTMDIRSAEVSKYAANTFLATKISFINEMANLCEIVGADIEKVRIGMCSDQRIGYSFLYPGIGYGGSCFPKDIKALIRTAKEFKYEMKILESVEHVNQKQKSLLFEKMKKYFSSCNENLQNKVIGIWGLSFKPETDDVREAPSINIIKMLLDEGAVIKAHDPKAGEEIKKIFPSSGDRLQLFNNNYDAVKDCDALALLTEWRMYRLPDFDRMKTLMKKPVIFDGRNQYNPEFLNKSGFEYFSIGRK
jgi:UDPglucose 6-dehydrogenase